MSEFQGYGASWHLYILLELRAWFKTAENTLKAMQLQYNMIYLEHCLEPNWCMVQKCFLMKRFILLYKNLLGYSNFDSFITKFEIKSNQILVGRYSYCFLILHSRLSYAMLFKRTVMKVWSQNFGWVKKVPITLDNDTDLIDLETSLLSNASRC